MDATTPINCQVGAIPLLLLTRALTIPNFSYGCFFQLCAYLPMRSRLRDENAYHLVDLFLDTFMRGLDFRFATDSSSHVRLHLQFNVNTFLGIRYLSISQRCDLEQK